MANDRPAVALAAVPGRRQRTLALAREIERRGFAGILVPSSAAGNRLVAFEELFAAFA